MVYFWSVWMPILKLKYLSDSIEHSCLIFPTISLKFLLTLMSLVIQFSFGNDTIWSNIYWFRIFFPKYKRYTFLMLSKLENISKYARIETLIWVSWKYGSFFVSHWNLAITWIEKHFWIGWKECQKKRKLEYCIGTIHVLRNHKTENPKFWLRNTWMVP